MRLSVEPFTGLPYLILHLSFDTSPNFCIYKSSAVNIRLIILMIEKSTKNNVDNMAVIDQSVLTSCHFEFITAIILSQ